MFSWEWVDGVFATKSEFVGLIVREISLQDFQPVWSWSTKVTDRRTDRQTIRRTTCKLNAALCTSASRCKNGRAHACTNHIWWCYPRESRMAMQRHLILTTEVTQIKTAKGGFNWMHLVRSASIPHPTPRAKVSENQSINHAAGDAPCQFYNKKALLAYRRKNRARQLKISIRMTFGIELGRIAR